MLDGTIDLERSTSWESYAWSPVVDPETEVLGSGADEPSLDLRRDRLEQRLFPSLASEPLRVGRFVLLSRLGAGGMGEVHAAYDEQLDRRVAIKLLRAEASEHARAQDRLLREAKVLARLSHPNVVQIHEAGVVDDRVFIAMELVDGHTLGEWLREHAPPVGDRRRWPVVVERFVQAGRGLAAAHALGLIHRDFKPDNVLVGRDGRVRVVDFGLARPVGVETSIDEGATLSVRPTNEASSSGSGSRQELASLTAAGTILGTIAYMAPEQLAGRSVDGRCDQFSFCVALFEALYGVRPFAARTMAARIIELGGALREPESIGSAPRWLHRALQRGLANEPEQRFADMESLLAVLSRPRRRRWWTAGVVVAGLAAAAGAVMAGRPSPCEIDGRALAGTWDDERRAAVRAAFAATDLEFATPTLTAVEGALDRWSTDWIAAQRLACEATRIAGVQSEALLDRRVACLERKRGETRAVVELLVDADQAIVAHAPELLTRLAALEPCADVDGLDERFPLPSDSAERAAIEAAFERAARVRSLTVVGELDRAAALAESLRVEVEGLGHPPLALSVEATRGEIALVRRDFAVAVPILLGVARDAERAQLDELVASVRVVLVGGTAGTWSRPEQEAWLLADAEAAVDRVAVDRDPRALELMRAHANLRENTGDYEGALAELEGLRGLARERDDALAVAQATRDIAEILRQLARYDEAVAEFERARAVAAARWGDRAPAVAHIEWELAGVEIDRGRSERAREHLARAEALYRAAFGPESYAVARVWLATAKLAMNEGELARARALAEQALEVYVRELGPTHEFVADAHEALGVLRFFAGDLAGSLAAYRHALEIRAGILEPDHPSLALLHSNIGESLAALGDHEGALAAYSQALTSFERSLPADHPNLALPLKGRAQSSLALGRTEPAIADLERALVLLQQGTHEPFELADTRFSLARALADASREPERARRLAEQALAGFEEVGQRERAERARAWLSVH
jgi:tetratricopeptide (TPR) repeat protein/tRNA A-37 threonylcarbamoyl transferase component Bud32